MLYRRRYVSGQRWTFWRWTDVVIGGLLYLRRLHILQTPLFSVMVHLIVRPDPQPDMHDHPVSFLSIPLRGWYDEEIPELWRGFSGNWYPIARRTRSLLCWRRFRATDRHRIVRVSPGGCLTLAIAGPVVRRWGFWTAAGWIPWREYKH